MELNEQSVNAYTTIMKNPSAHGLPYRNLADCFEPAETATPKHLLFADYCPFLGLIPSPLGEDFSFHMYNT